MTKYSTKAQEFTWKIVLIHFIDFVREYLRNERNFFMSVLIGIYIIDRANGNSNDYVWSFITRAYYKQI